jgi:hypothetical protein
MSPARSDGAIVGPNTAERLYEMPAPEYLNFVGKLSEVSMGMRPCRSPTPKNVIKQSRIII